MLFVCSLYVSTLQARNLNQLDVVVVDVLEDEDPILNETKISSSTRRRLELGRLLKEPNQ